MRRNMLSLLVVLVFSAAATQAEDWPQWEGPNRDSVWPEDGIVDRFPDQGLPIVWRAEVGLGYAGPAVADGRIYLMDYLRESGELTNNPGKRDKLTGKERVLCLDAKTGTPIWKHEYAREYNLSYPGGPRAHPPSSAAKSTPWGRKGTCGVSMPRTGK